MLIYVVWTIKGRETEDNAEGANEADSLKQAEPCATEGLLEDLRG